MTTKFSMIRDINGYNGFGLQFCDDNEMVLLAASEDTTLTVPSAANQYLALFSIPSGADVWVANNATSEFPSLDEFESTSSVLNPTARLVNGGDILHFITPSSNIAISVSFYAIA